MNNSSAFYWIGLNLLSIIVLGFYSMQEMACVSINKIRLHYYVSKGMKRAIWLTYMLQDPTRLFGTTLLCVNAAMMVGSEFSRESYIALGLDPDLAPLSQVLLVVVLAELAPMFAARRYAEHVAMLGTPILYATAKVMAPFLWSIGWITKFANFIVGGKKAHPHIVLNREDLQKILEEQDEDRPSESEGRDFNTVTWNIFSLRNKDAQKIMTPINQVPLISSIATIGQLRDLLQKTDVEYIPVYHRDTTHIVGIVSPKELIRVPDTRKVRDHASPPWFIVQHTKLPRIFKECRRNSKNIAIVLDDQGLALGVITLSDLIEEIFGEFGASKSSELAKQTVMIDRTFSGQYTVGEFNHQFDVILDKNENLTLEELMTQTLGHHPEADESIYLPPFELTVKEASLMEVKKITITTRI